MKGPSPSPPRRTLGTSDNRRLPPFAHPGSPTVRLLGRSMDSQASHRCRSCLIPFSASCVLISIRWSGAKVNFDLQMFDFLPKIYIPAVHVATTVPADASRLHMSVRCISCAILSNVSVLTTQLPDYRRGSRNYSKLLLESGPPRLHSLHCARSVSR